MCVGKVLDPLSSLISNGNLVDWLLRVFLSFPPRCESLREAGETVQC